MLSLDNILIRLGCMGLEGAFLSGVGQNYGKCGWLESIPAFYSSLKDVMMLVLKLLARLTVRLGKLMSDDLDIEPVVRAVLRRELRLNNVRLHDNLIELDPDFPTEEVVRDVAEELGQRLSRPQLDDWTGSLVDLIRVVRRELEMLDGTRSDPSDDTTSSQ